MIKNFAELQERVRSSEPLVVSVAQAADQEVLLSVKAAADQGFIKPVLTGDRERIEELCGRIGLKPLEILQAGTEEEAVERAVRAVHDGSAQVLMKGLVNTSVYMRGILNREWGLRTGRLLSMMAVYEAPGYHKLLFCSDSGIFTDDLHTKYTADSAENVKAIQALADTDGKIAFDASIAGGDEINLFRQGVLNVAFCWNIAQQLNSDNNDAGLTNNGDEIVFMAFPAEKADATQLCGGIWGFGVFDNGDADRIAASKLFIKYMADSADGTADAVLSSTYFPVRDTVEGTDLTGLYNDVPTMQEYSKLMQFLGDYYQVTPGWTEARTAWWNMLQQVGSGADVQTAVDEFVSTANAAAAAQ